jgi:peptide deformylase
MAPISILPIYLYGSEVLRKKAKPIRELDDTVIRLMYDMTETMRKANGVGLAATQVGELRRMLVADVSAIERSGKEDEEEYHGYEGCWLQQTSRLERPPCHLHVFFINGKRDY